MQYTFVYYSHTNAMASSRGKLMYIRNVLVGYYVMYCRYTICFLFFRWVPMRVKIGRYLDPFSVSIDVARHNESGPRSYIAFDAVRLHNCAPGQFRLF